MANLNKIKRSHTHYTAFTRKRFTLCVRACVFCAQHITIKYFAIMKTISSGFSGCSICQKLFSNKPKLIVNIVLCVWVYEQVNECARVCVFVCEDYREFHLHSTSTSTPIALGACNANATSVMIISNSSHKLHHTNPAEAILKESQLHWNLYNLGWSIV